MGGRRGGLFSGGGGGGGGGVQTCLCLGGNSFVMFVKVSPNICILLCLVLFQSVQP